MSFLSGTATGSKSLLNQSIMYQRQSAQAAKAAYDVEANNLFGQADIAYKESLAEASRKAQEVQAFRESQAETYSSSGILLAGSPLAVLEETRQKGAAEVEAIKNRGVAIRDLYRAKGYQTVNLGRSALLGTEAQIQSTLYQYDQAKRTAKAGMWKQFVDWGVEAGMRKFLK